MSDRPSKQNKVEDRTIKSKRKRENKKPNFRNKESLKKPRKFRGRIIDYKINKGWGKIMILEGPEKFVHFQFWKKNINPSIEHHIYKNQEVSVQLDKKEGGHQLVTKIDYFLKDEIQITKTPEIAEALLIEIIRIGDLVIKIDRPIKIQIEIE